jgi:hypothetical protein
VAAAAPFAQSTAIFRMRMLPSGTESGQQVLHIKPALLPVPQK